MKVGGSTLSPTMNKPMIAQPRGHSGGDPFAHLVSRNNMGQQQHQMQRQRMVQQQRMMQHQQNMRMRQQQQQTMVGVATNQMDPFAHLSMAGH